MSRRKVKVEQKGPGAWRVLVERTLHGESATGEVTIARADDPGEKNVSHESLAGSRAWLALGEKLLDGGEIESAIESVTKGLDELGNRYSDPRNVDDTSLKLEAARERIESGHKADGARIMLTMLKNRLAMYASLHQSDILE